MCSDQDVSLHLLGNAPQEHTKEKLGAGAWSNLQGWRHAVDLGIEFDQGRTSFPAEPLSFDVPDFGLDFDPFVQDFESSTPGPDVMDNAKPAMSTVSQTTSKESWSSETEDFPPRLSSETTTPDISPTVKEEPEKVKEEPEKEQKSTTRLPKWKRRNPEKHLEGERNRRAKRRNRIQTLKQMLSKTNGKSTTNDLLIATITRVKEALALKDKIDFRQALRCSRAFASIAVDEADRVVEASQSFCDFVQWPQQLVAGHHLGCFVHSDDVSKLCLALENDRKIQRSLQVQTPTQLVGLLRLIRSESAEGISRPLQVDVSIVGALTVLSFINPDA